MVIDGETAIPIYTILESSRLENFSHVIGDAHVYRNHVVPLEEQLARQPKPFPDRFTIVGCILLRGLSFGLSLRFWIDTADKQPCIATGGMIPWTLKATGKLFHSGLAHKLLSLLLPATFSSGLVQIASLTDLYFSSFVPGAAAGLSYAYILAMAPLGILSSIIILPVVPTFSTLAEPSMWVRLQENLEKAILLCLEFSKRRKDW